MSIYKLDVDKIMALSVKQGIPTMAKLCESVGVNRSRASEWKHRGVYPGTVQRIALVLDVDPKELIIGEK